MARKTPCGGLWSVVRIDNGLELAAGCNLMVAVRVCWERIELCGQKVQICFIQGVPHVIRGSEKTI